MPSVQTGRKTDSKGTCTTSQNKANVENELATSETDSGWKSPCRLKKEVQTIIDIMGPPLSSNFNYNTSSEADNEESIFSNSKLSSDQLNKECFCKDESEKSDSLFRKGVNLSTAVDLNTSTSVTMEELTDSKGNFPYVESVCGNTQYICPPPLMPANVCINSECFCPQVASLLHERNFQPGFPASCKHELPLSKCGNLDSNQFNAGNSFKLNKNSKNVVINWLKAMVSPTKDLNEATNCNPEYYKMNVKMKRGNDKSPPRRVVFELVKNAPSKTMECCEIYEHETLTVSKNKKNCKNERLQTRVELRPTDVASVSENSRKPIEKTTHCDSNGRTRVDLYYFDHGSFNHYKTTDAPPMVTTEEVAEMTEKYTTRFWAEIFGTIHIGFSFATSFILQMLRFILYSICRPLTIGLIQLGSDYFLKPLLATIFNGIIQPVLIFLHNILASLRELCDPIAEGVGYFIRELAFLVRSFRIVEISKPDCTGEAKVKRTKV